MPLFKGSGTKADSRESSIVSLQLRYHILIALCVLVIVGVVIAYGVVLQPRNYWPTVVACTLGGLLAIAELVARYRDDPGAAVLSLPAAVYVSVNATAAGVALYLIHVFGWTFGASGSALLPTQVLAAGLGSAALFRSSFFTIPAGDQNIGIGPAEILRVILAAADRAVDRRRAMIRATRAAQIMQGLAFKDSSDSLFAYCVATMQNVSPEETQDVKAKIKSLRNDDDNRDIHDTIKAYILGLELLTLVGDRVLTGATKQFKAVLAGSPERDDTGRKTEAILKVLNILKVLREEGGEMPLVELRQKVGLQLDESYLIENLQNEGFVELQRNEDGGDIIRVAAVN